ncbi:MAG: LacI family DNA-binding transcriptional regulator [Verrucomicrobiota bacterium]
MKKNIPTLKSIATHLDLGITTVSDILLREKTNYRKATIERVQKAAAKMGFQPNGIAQSMRRGSTETIGLLITMNIVDPFFAELVNRLEQRFEQEGFMVILSISENDIEKDKRALRFFESRRVDGLVIGPVYNTQGTLDQSVHYQTSLSTVMLLASENTHADSVSIDHSRMCRLAVEYFLRRGHTRVGYLMCPDHPHKNVGGTAYHGFREALDERGLYHEKWVWIDSNPVAERAYAQMRDILAKTTLDALPTAFFCHNDYCAGGAMAAVREAGYRIPEDFSFIGCDNIKSSPYTVPPLTTIDLKPVELADRTFEFLIDRMAHRRKPIRYLEIIPDLIERASVAKPRRRSR